MNEKPGLEPGFFARRATGGLTGYALLPVPRTCRCYDLCHACRFGTFDNFVSARNLTAPIVAHAGFDVFYFAGGIAFLWRTYNRAW